MNAFALQLGPAQNSGPIERWGTSVFALFDDMYVVCPPDRIGQIKRAIETKDWHLHPSGQDEVVKCSRMQAVRDRHIDSGSATKIARGGGVERRSRSPGVETRNESPGCPSWP